MAIGIDVEHSVAHTYTQNGLTESFIKRLKFITRALILNSNLAFTIWGHAIMHATSLIQIRSSAYHSCSPLQLIRGHEPYISHLQVFGRAIYVLIASPQHAKMGRQKRLGIYIGYESPTILKYLEPLIGDLFTTYFIDYQFDNAHFPTLIPFSTKQCREISQKEDQLNSFDPRTSQSELDIKKIVQLQQTIAQLPDACTDVKGMTKSHIPSANTLERVVVLTNDEKSVELETRQKRGWPIGAKDKNR